MLKFIQKVDLENKKEKIIWNEQTFVLLYLFKICRGEIKLFQS